MGNAGTGKTKMRLDLVTSSCSTGAPPFTKSGSNSSGYLHTYCWDSNDVAMTQLYIPNGDHLTTSYGPQSLYIRGYDSGWKSWHPIATSDVEYIYTENCFKYEPEFRKFVCIGGTDQNWNK